jgi:hypothetical protein
MASQMNIILGARKSGKTRLAASLLRRASAAKPKAPIVIVTSDLTTLGAIWGHLSVSMRHQVIVTATLTGAAERYLGALDEDEDVILVVDVGLALPWELSVGTLRLLTGASTTLIWVASCWTTEDDHVTNAILVHARGLKAPHSVFVALRSEETSEVDVFRAARASGVALSSSSLARIIADTRASGYRAVHFGVAGGTCPFRGFASDPTLSRDADLDSVVHNVDITTLAAHAAVVV